MAAANHQPRGLPKQSLAPAKKDASQAEGRSHAADPAITQDVVGQRKVHARGLPSPSTPVSSQFPDPKWG